MSHAGSALLAQVADQLGLTRALSRRLGAMQAAPAAATIRAG